MDDSDAEVSAVFGRAVVPPLAVQATGVANQGTPKYTIIDMGGLSPTGLMHSEKPQWAAKLNAFIWLPSASTLQDRSDDEESDHTPDPYSQHMKGRVSPSPYTANTERARQFNAYVRGIIELKLDVLVPISHQPRELITEIIADASTKFPEFASCVRKRIRTFLKSYRRSKKIKEVVSVSPAQNGVTSSASKMEEAPVNAVLPTAIAPTINSTEVQQPPTCTAVVTISQMREEPPEAKRMKLSPTPQTLRPLVPSASQVLNTSEVTAVRQLITGYRESAAFLQRAADQLETMLAKEASTSV